MHGLLQSAVASQVGVGNTDTDPADLHVWADTWERIETTKILWQTMTRPSADNILFAFDTSIHIKRDSTKQDQESRVREDLCELVSYFFHLLSERRPNSKKKDWESIRKWIVGRKNKARKPM